MHAGADVVVTGTTPGPGKDSVMADVAYVALTVAAFLLLALMVRGLEKLR
ncbi:MAG TPA: hypothetical protein VFW65_04700 [Pseudonocardiaceae bacterium]|nr:hypothetical protein [Pseudonocardiaceae bacterium]